MSVRPSVSPLKAKMYVNIKWDICPTTPLGQTWRWKYLTYFACARFFLLFLKIWVLIQNQLPIPRYPQNGWKGSRKRRKKYVLTMASYAPERHHVWCTQAVWTNYVQPETSGATARTQEQEQFCKIHLFKNLKFLHLILTRLSQTFVVRIWFFSSWNKEYIRTCNTLTYLPSYSYKHIICKVCLITSSLDQIKKVTK